MTAALRDLGERVAGQVIDETAWQRGVSTATGEAVTIKVARP